MKKFLLLVLVLVFTLTLAFSLTACNKDKNQAEDQKVITYLGDSICEALIGASPLSERDNYGYYALVGRMNNFKYYNHSVSGHQTSDGMLKDGYGLLELISSEYEDAVLVQSHIKEADMIHISILGNNALQFDLGLLMMEAAKPTFEQEFAAGTSLLNHMINGIEGLSKKQYQRTSLVDGTTVEFKFPNTYENICDIVSKLKELNPTAKIIFQKVYNPVFEGTTLLKKEYKEALAKIDDGGRFGGTGKITEWSQIRAVAQVILDKLNGVLDTYAAANPGQIEILDINSYFSEIAGTDFSTNSAGAQLIYADWTHPSNKGHAAIAAKTQEWVESLGYASPNALAKYKEIKIEQINRMYKGQEGFNADAAINAINNANSITAVSAAYFNATDAFTPNYSRENLSYDRSGEKYYSKTTKFAIAQYDGQEELGLRVAGIGDTTMSIIEGLAFNMEYCYAEFTTDGKMHFQLQTADGLLGSIDELLEDFDMTMEDLEAGLAAFDLNGAVDQFVAQLFPGFNVANLKESLDKIEESLGVNITGLDYSKQQIKDLIASIATTGKLPGDLLTQLNKIQSDLVLTLTMDVDYRIKTVKSVSGKEFTAIYLGKEVATNPDTQPIGIFTETTLADGRKHLLLTIDFIGLYLPLVEIVD